MAVLDEQTIIAPEEEVITPVEVTQPTAEVLPTDATPATADVTETTAAQYITPEATVSGQLETLLAEDSPYLQQAGIRAREQASDLGLLSSSMAVGAAERERLAAALPVAQADAATYAGSALSEQQAAETSALSEQQAGETSVLSAQEAAQNIEALETQGKIQYDIEAYSQEQQTLRTTMELSTNRALSASELSSEESQAYINSASTLGANYSQDVAAILQSQDFASETDRTTALMELEETYVNNMEFLASAADIPLDWTIGTGGGEGTPSEETLPEGGTVLETAAEYQENPEDSVAQGSTTPVGIRLDNGYFMSVPPGTISIGRWVSDQGITQGWSLA
jgi:hypothetical protein